MGSRRQCVWVRGRPAGALLPWRTEAVFGARALGGESLGFAIAFWFTFGQFVSSAEGTVRRLASHQKDISCTLHWILIRVCAVCARPQSLSLALRQWPSLLTLTDDTHIIRNLDERLARFQPCRWRCHEL